MITAPRMNIPLKEVPFSTSVIDSTTLDKTARGVSLDESLKLVPGVKVDNQTNSERVHLSIRGQGILTERGIRGIKILQDGISLNDPTGFAPDFYDVDFSNVEKIEVLRGPSASLYGGSATGGIINITTPDAPNVPLFGEVYGNFGSNAFWKEGGKFGGATKDVNYMISLSRTMGDGYRQHSEFWGNNVSGKLTYTPSEYITLTPIFIYSDVYTENPEEINSTLFNLDPRLPNPLAIPFDEYLETNRITNGLTGEVKIASDQDIKFNAFVKRTLYTESIDGAINNRTILTPGTSIQYDLNYGRPEDFLRNHVSLGTDLSWQTIEDKWVQHWNDSLANPYILPQDILLSNDKINQSGVGVFVIDKMDISQLWNVMLSLRYDKMHNQLNDQLAAIEPDHSGSADFSKTTGRIGLTYSPSPELNLFTNWGEGFLPPSTEELAQNPDHFGGFNTHLTFATSNEIDLGARGSLNNNINYDVTAFYLKTNNDFERYRIDDQLREQLTFYRNSDTTRRIGLEVYASYSPVKSLTCQVAYTYSDFKYTNVTPVPLYMNDTTIIKYISKGHVLPSSPRHQLYIDVQYSLLPELSIGASTEMLTKQYIDGGNLESESAPGFTLYHARIKYDWSLQGFNGELTLTCKNITNQRYNAYLEPDPNGDSHQPGAGREFFGGVKFRF